MKSDPQACQYTALRAATLIEAGTLTAETLVRSCLEHIEARDGPIQAWAHLDSAGAIESARRADAGSRTGLLHGIPVGFKDNIDTARMPTAYGSPIHAGHRPAHDAACVALSRHAGAIVLGKTASTEFAYREPSRCTNPHDAARSPGGSSSGSAAAVAAHMVPLAAGTQTAGSVIRPAAYCGVHAIMPRHGELSFAGIKNLAESFDTLGFMARDLDDLALFGAVLQMTPYREVGAGLEGAPKLAVYRSAFWDEAQPAARAHFDTLVATLARRGAAIEEVSLPGLDERMLQACWTVTKFEGGRQLIDEWRNHRDGLSEAARQLVRDAQGIPLAEYHEAMRRIEAGRRELQDRLAGYDATLSLSSAGEAPLGLHDTGPVTFNYLWTVAHLAALNLPLFTGPKGLPIGIQVVSVDRDLLGLLKVGRWIERGI
jgi:Asp-tRNA(Asn)/Glu-tRNA(Gln) amidotransferase A subunit family amidase